MPRLKKPSFKQKQFARAYVKHKGNGTQAALEVYDSDYKNAQAIAYQNMQKPAVLEEIENVKKTLTDKGLNLDYLAEKARQSIENGMGNKATQSDANAMIQFLYKLHNALPANRNISTKVNMNYNLPSNINEIKENLTKTNALTQSLLSDLSST